MRKRVGKIFFYHSFPKKEDCKNEKEQIYKGIKIIESMVERGFLLMPEPEPIDWKKHLNLKINFPRILQKRICFTAIERKELEAHMERWGIFSLEFDAKNIRHLGAMPVFYVPSLTEKEIHHKNPAQNLVERLLSSWCLFQMKKDSYHLFGIKGIFGLLLPTELSSQNIELENFRLKEWRITGNTLQFLGLQEELDSSDRKKLKGLVNEKHFLGCWKFHILNDRHVLTYANKIIVPDNLVNEVEQILKTGIDEPPKIMPISDLRK